MHVLTRGQTITGVIAALLLVCVVFSSWLIIRSSSIGGQSSTIAGPPPSWPAPITFAPSVSYNQALRLVTDMGLQPSLECPPQAGHYTPGSTLQPQPVWQPVGQKETFLQNHQLQVYPTFSAPSDWRLRLAAIQGIHVGVSQGNICPHVIYGTPPPGTIMPLSSSQSGIYVRITFTNLQTYDAALYTVSNLGLGLANICYEQAEVAAGRGPEPSWQFTGEEQMFAKTHTLTVTTTARHIQHMANAATDPCWRRFDQGTLYSHMPNKIIYVSCQYFSIIIKKSSH